MSSSKYREAANKVVVVNFNDFYAVKKINQRKKEKLYNAERNQAIRNASSISKDCDGTISSTSSTSTPQAGTSSKTIDETIAHMSTSTCLHASTSSKSSIRKLVSKKHVVVKRQSLKSVLKKKCKRTIPIVEKNVAKIIFPNLSSATDTEGETVVVEGTSRNKSVCISENMTEEKVMKLISKKYGKALEAQISLFQENGDTTQTSLQETKISAAITSTLRNDINDDELKEEPLLNKLGELNECEEIEKAKTHLETIVILDSPKKEYQILSNADLKNLPNKIFASPTIKHEIQSPKKDITEGNGEDLKIIPKSVLPLPNLILEEDATTLGVSSEVGLLMTTTRSSKFISNIEENHPNNMAMGSYNKRVEVIGGKKFWELEQKDLNFDILIADEKRVESKEKKIVISNEDAVIFKEMDQFIEDIEVKNATIEKETLVPKHTAEEDKENVNPNYENVDQNGVISPSDLLKEFDDIVKQRMSSNYVQATISLDDAEDQLIFEIGKKCENKNQNEQLLTFPGNFPDTTFKVPEAKHSTTEKKTEKQDKDNVARSPSPKKDNILEQLVTETGIKKFEVQITESGNATGTQLAKLKEGSVPIKDPNRSLDLFAAENIPDQAKRICAGNYKSEESLNAADPNMAEVPFKENTNSEDSIEICPSSKCEQINSSEYQILIIKEGGFLEPLNPDGTTPHTDLNNSNRNYDSSPDQSGLNGEKQIYEDEVSKEEILALLEKAKAIKFEVTTEGSKIEKLKSFSHTLRDQIKILKQLYEKLQSFTDSAGKELDKDLKDEEMCALQANFNFIKGIIENTFNKDEKKLKFKVISITKKTEDHVKSVTSTKPITKKVYRRTVPRTVRRPPNKLLRRTLFRMDRLLVALEMNRALLLNARQQAFVSKLKQLAKRDVECKEMEKVSDTRSFSDVDNSGSESNEVVDDEEPAIANDEIKETVASNSKKPHADDKLLTVALERSDGAFLSKTKNTLLKEQSVFMTDDQKDVESSLKDEKLFDTAALKELGQKGGSKPTPNMDKKELGNDRRISERLKKVPKPKQLRSSRYLLRSRPEKSINTDLDDSKESCEGEPTRQTKNRPSYEVVCSKVLPLDKMRHRDFDYDLENDNKPRVVLCHKAFKSEPIFEETFDDFQNRNIADVLKEGSIKKRSGKNRYETRSKTQEQMVLRSKKM